MDTSNTASAATTAEQGLAITPGKETKPPQKMRRIFDPKLGAYTMVAVNPNENVVGWVVKNARVEQTPNYRTFFGGKHPTTRATVAAFIKRVARRRAHNKMKAASQRAQRAAA